jgi:hypothetical protein
MWNGKKIQLEPGQFVSGRNKISKETGVSPSSVNRSIKFFVSEQQLEQQATTTSSLFTITNWGQYQVSEHQNGQRVDSGWTTDGQRVDTKQEGNNVNNASYTLLREGMSFEQSAKAIQACHDGFGKIGIESIIQVLRVNGAMSPLDMKLTDKAAKAVELMAMDKAGAHLQAPLQTLRNYLSYEERPKNDHEERFAHSHGTGGL